MSVYQNTKLTTLEIIFITIIVLLVCLIVAGVSYFCYVIVKVFKNQKRQYVNSVEEPLDTKIVYTINDTHEHNCEVVLAEQIWVPSVLISDNTLPCSVSSAREIQQ
ncbi:hypothetical protein SS50377_28542 [Spironucleus salmonicida]|uniref:Uncharacterized protein n=1 Tax=Spironucleus salmonicida TaxID=348837 RepID=V6LD70_9EUKA|nr:hypothetical protein SS50377_28542 [Spironucleus salmonicida]|eukprot:EST41626.1 Hypothetical protein SS50377_18981 [Spironucleus salmonicida]